MPLLGSLVDDTVEERISELEDMSVETFQMKKREKTKQKTTKKPEYPRTMEQPQKI